MVTLYCSCTSSYESTREGSFQLASQLYARSFCRSVLAAALGSINHRVLTLVADEVLKVACIVQTPCSLKSGVGRRLALHHLLLGIEEQRRPWRRDEKARQLFYQQQMHNARRGSRNASNSSYQQQWTTTPGMTSTMAQTSEYFSCASSRPKAAISIGTWKRWLPWDTLRDVIYAEQNTNLDRLDICKALKSLYPEEVQFQDMSVWDVEKMAEGPSVPIPLSPAILWIAEL